MSVHAEIKAVFKEPSLEYEDITISLEQEPWDDNTGLMKKSDFYGLISSLLNYNSIVGTMDCGIKSNGDVKSAIYVYVYPLDLQYTLKTNYGTLGSRKVEIISQTEVASFSVSNTHSLSKVPIADVSWKWIGKVYDKTGNSISPPSVSIDERGNVRLRKKVYGDLQLTYKYSRHRYNFKANVADGFVSGPHTVTTGEAVNNLIAYAIWFRDTITVGQDEEKGGIVWLNLTPPPNSDANGVESADCGWYLAKEEPDDDSEEDEDDSDEDEDDSDEDDSDEDEDLSDEELSDLDENDEDLDEDDGSGGFWREDDEEDEEEVVDPEAQFVDKIIRVNYCTQEVISESIQKRDPAGGSSSLTTF